MTRNVLLLAVLVSACSAAPQGTPKASLGVPEDLQSCAPPVPTPRPLPRIRTPQQIAKGYDAVDLAREAAGRARNDCADKLARLNAWVREHIKP